MRNELVFDGVNLSDFSAYVASSNFLDGSERDINSVAVPGRNGNVILDNGRFINFPLIENIYINEETIENADALRNYLAAHSHKYFRIEETLTPEIYRMARFTGSFEMSVFDSNGGTVTAEFDCKPQRFLKSGLQTVEITGSGTIENPTFFESPPLLTVYGAGTIGINDETITIRNDAYGEITLSDHYMGRFFNPSYAGLFNEGDYITFGSGCVAVDIVLSDTVLPDSVAVSLTGDLPSEIRDVTVTSSGRFIRVRFWFFQNVQAISSSTEYWDVNYEINADTSSGNAQVRGYFRESIDVDREFVRVLTTITQMSGYVTKAPTTFDITGITGNSTIGGSWPFMVDLDSLKAYKEIDGQMVNLNHLIEYGIDPPTLKPGTNEITVDTYPSTQVDIVPRWWTL